MAVAIPRVLSSFFVKSRRSGNRNETPSRGCALAPELQADVPMLTPPPPATLTEHDLTRLSFFVDAIVNRPTSAERLQAHVLAGRPPSQALRDAVESLVAEFAANSDQLVDEQRRVPTIRLIAERLISVGGAAQVAGRALAGSLEQKGLDGRP
jgi:hypothetical protein